MSFPDITAQIARALSLTPEQSRIDALFSVEGLDVVEWSVNTEGDPRGRLRVAVWSTEVARVRGALDRLSHPFASSLYHEIEHGIRQAGVGVALSKEDTTIRLWAAPRPSFRRGLLDVSLALEPRLAEPVETLFHRCGGMAAFEGLSVEGRGDRMLRCTVYCTVPDRDAAERLLGEIPCRPSPKRDAFLKAFLGIEARHPKAFPKVWVGRSVGRSGGYKLYSFVRHDPRALPDTIVLDLLGADPPVREVHRILAPHAPQRHQRAGLIHLVGLTIPDDTHEPRATIYFALGGGEIGV